MKASRNHLYTQSDNEVADEEDFNISLRQFDGKRIIWRFWENDTLAQLRPRIDQVTGRKGIQPELQKHKGNL